MGTMTEYIVVFVTAPNEDEAAKIAHAVVSQKLAACVNIIRSIRSIYRWQGKIEDGAESLMIIKTRAYLFEKLSAKIKTMHTYAVPEIISVPIIEGSNSYLNWIREVTGE